jgi:hypothetical protein
MIAKIKKHFWYYFSFFCIELSGLGAIFFFVYDRTLQMVVIFLMALFYIVWSIFHHYIHHNLTTKIFIEYVLIGFLGEVILFLLLV